ncbi:MAG: DUF3243 family protein [Firmicutes bacterium]|nr:DUF3243 family protein [Bacillota bacterium]
MGRDTISNFPEELAQNIRDGLKHGLSEEMMVKGLVSVGNLMSRFVKPDSVEESLMNEIWQTATDEEKRMLAEIVLRMGKKRVH